jgi:hypothetical protein
MQPHSFSKRQLAATALMLDGEEKKAALSDKKKRMWVHKCLRSRKSEGEYWTLNKELVDDEMKFYQYFRISKHQFNYLLQKIEKDLKKKNTTQDRKAKGTVGRSSSIIGFPEPGESWKMHLE